MSEPTFETINGAWRAVDGTFFMPPSRDFYADGRTTVPTDKRDELVSRVMGQLLRITSALARADFWSWRDIGGVLGRSASALHERFAKKRVSRRQRRGR